MSSSSQGWSQETQNGGQKPETMSNYLGGVDGLSPQLPHQQLQMQPSQLSTNNLDYSNTQANLYQPCHLDLEAEHLCNGVYSTLMTAIDASNHMPLTEHVYYSSFESYDNIMVEQRRTLNDMMIDLSRCSDKYDHYINGSYVASNPHLQQFTNLATSGSDYDTIESLRDRYETVLDFSETMFDKIGQNLDDAAGLLTRDARMVQATLEAANHAKLPKHRGNQTSSTSRNNNTPSSLSTTSSSSSSTSSSSSLTNNKINEQNTTCTNLNINSQQNNFHRIRQQQTNQACKFVPSQVNSVVQSFYTQQPPRGFSGGYLGKQQYGSPSQRFAQLENKNIPRPQNNFKDKIDNSYRPFQPIIKEKPNALVPLKLIIEHDDHGGDFFTHPYEHELQNFQVDLDLLSPANPIEPPDLYSTPIILVETLEQLEEVCGYMENEKEFAVDVEHHSYRSFQGITCLVQISTRTQDFVIDAIKLRGEMYRLNKSFTNPSIVKVFHGADCDVLWLQRDFGVYVVNLFDTSRAAKLMKFAHLSLAFLLKHYCNVEPDKSYQLADWRERPLPLPMLQYARADTHYLLYIYDRLRNDLLTRSTRNKVIGMDLMRSVFERGREICLKRYEKPPFSDRSHLSVLRKSRSTFNAKQMYAFKELYAWRDSISRELDESVGYVLPNNLMIRIAEYLPREPQGITALCNPMPPVLKKYLSDIHAIILKAIDVPLDDSIKGPIGGKTDPSTNSIDLDSINHKHDIAHSAGLHENSVPNLLDSMYQLRCSSDTKPSVGQRLYGSSPPKVRHPGQSPTRLYNFLGAKHN